MLNSTAQMQIKVAPTLTKHHMEKLFGLTFLLLA